MKLEFTESEAKAIKEFGNAMIEKTVNEMWAAKYNLLSSVMKSIDVTEDDKHKTAKGDSFDVNSDFVGIVFDMLNNWNLESDLHLWFGKNMFRVSQVLRLCQKIQPNLVQNMRVFTGA